MFNQTSLAKLLCIFAFAFLAISLMGSLFAPTTALADNPPGEPDPPIDSYSTNDTTGTGQGSPEEPVIEQPWDVDLVLFLLTFIY
jgi:hypothetical protein